MGDNIIFVDDDREPEWYNETQFKTIQEGIENASGGDIIFVYTGTYYETIKVYRPVDIYGEDKNITIIDGKSTGNVVTIIADKVCFNGFTIRMSSRKFLSENSGIEVKSDNTTISNNIVIKNVNGIRIFEGSRNKIINNIVITNKRRFFISEGIDLSYAHDNIISGNLVSNNGGFGGISLYKSNRNLIKNNTAKKNLGRGIVISRSKFNNISNNDIIGNVIGLTFYESMYNNVTKNNFVLNLQQANFHGEKNLYFNNTWDKNYWNRPRILPYCIFGSMILRIPFTFSLIRIPLVNFDWHPTKKPYNI